MSRLFSQMYSFLCQNLFLNLQLILMLICFMFNNQVDAAPSYYPMGGSENPVMRQYKLLSLMGSPSPAASYGGLPPANRKATRSASRNCFFSPVQCHLSKTSLDSGRQRRRIFNGPTNAAAPSFDNFSPRFRRAGPTWSYNGYYY